MNVNIARFILALVVGSGLGQLTQAKAPIMPEETPRAAGFEVSGSVFTPLFTETFSDNPFDALDTVTRTPRQLEIDLRPDDSVVPVIASSDITLSQAADDASSGWSVAGGIWLFLGGIWIIGTLVHHRHTIQTS